MGKHLSPEVKAKIVRLVTEHEISSRLVGQRFGISGSTVQHLVRAAKRDESHGMRQGVSSTEDLTGNVT